MPATLTREPAARPPAPGPPSGSSPRLPRFAADAGDAWPRTNRLLPWLLALFLAMLWLIPFDSTQLRIDAPIDLKLDRLLIMVIAITWLASLFAGGRATPRWRPTAIDALVLAFAGIALLSVVLNIATLVKLGESDLAFKRISLLASYVTFFFVMATTVRPGEVRAFVRLFMGLGAVCAVGTLVQYFDPSHVNRFHTWWQQLLPDSLFAFRPIGGMSRFAPVPITGPTIHALALAAMFAMVLAFAIVGILQSRKDTHKIGYALLTALYLGAVLATSRKTGAFASLGAIGLLCAYRPREMLRLAPFVVVVFMALLWLRPSAVEQQVKQVQPSKISAGASGQARSADYEAIVPDVRHKLLTGRGWGTYAAKKYRVLDNQYLGLLIETGLLGLAAFALLVISIPVVAYRVVRQRHPGRAPPALAAAAGAVSFGVAMALFDALAFPQGPYMLFFLGAIVVITRGAAAEEDHEPSAAARIVATRIVPPPVRRALGARRVRRGPELPQRRLGRRTRRGSEELPGRQGAPGVPGPAAAPGAPHVPAEGDAPHSPREPVRPRRRLVPGRVRGAAARARRSRAGRVGAGMLALGLALAVFGRGGGAPTPGLPGMSAGGESGGADPFAAVAGPRRRAAARAVEPSVGAPVTTSAGTTTVAALPSVPAPAPPAPGPGAGRPVTPRPTPPAPQPRRPRPPAPVPAPAPVVPPATVAQNPAEPDCLPGDAEITLVNLGLPRCPTTADVSVLQAAAVGGRLTADELQVVLAALRVARA
ncbi:MAG: hypothetical protein QOJ97_1378 [Solirubrobacteraceae bacterium]|jgi:O-antigen ligase|nr:hypothetical protein [Solirubrobacteraceae bacterium]